MEIKQMYDMSGCAHCHEQIKQDKRWDGASLRR